jgi:hypothetical protein
MTLSIKDARKRNTMRFVFFLLATLITSNVAQARSGTESVYYTITGPELHSLLQSWGYRAELTSDSTGAPKINSTASGVNFSIWFYGCSDDQVSECSSFSFSAGFDLGDGIEPAKINEWNRTERFGTAYYDEENDPYLDMNVNIDGGATADLLRDWMRWWEVGLSDFTVHIGWRS